jgi:hypothetical protein
VTGSPPFSFIMVIGIVQLYRQFADALFEQERRTCVSFVMIIAGGPCMCHEAVSLQPMVSAETGVTSSPRQHGLIGLLTHLFVKPAPLSGSYATLLLSMMDCSAFRIVFHSRFSGA